MKHLPWLVLISLSLVSCSGSKSAQGVGQEAPQVELSDADEFVENPNEQPAAEPTEAGLAAGAEAPAPGAENPAGAEGASATASAETPVVEENAPQVAASPAAGGGAEISAAVEADGTYKVKKNETLMMIAFKIYGDYSKWKSLVNSNKELLKDGANVREGMTLKFNAPAEKFVWNPQGSPYLIKTGDTLGIISNSVYKTTKKWKMIWDNNKPLIKDPNRIFAGFTLYYLENGREVAADI